MAEGQLRVVEHDECPLGRQVRRAVGIDASDETHRIGSDDGFHFFGKHAACSYPTLTLVTRVGGTRAGRLSVSARGAPTCIYIRSPLVGTRMAATKTKGSRGAARRNRGRASEELLAGLSTTWRHLPTSEVRPARAVHDLQQTMRDAAQQ